MKNQADFSHVTSSTVAAALGLTVRSVNNLRNEGVIPTVEQSGNSYYYNLPNVVAAYIDFKTAGYDESNEGAIAARNKADARYKKAKAEQAELQVSEIRGQMHRSEDVEAAFTQFGMAVRGEFLALPGRVAIDVSHTETPMEAAAIIKSACYESLNRLSEFQYKPEFYAERVRDRVQWLSDSDLGKIAKKDTSEK